MTTTTLRACRADNDGASMRRSSRRVVECARGIYLPFLLFSRRIESISLGEEPPSSRGFLLRGRSAFSRQIYIHFSVSSWTISPRPPHPAKHTPSDRCRPRHLIFERWISSSLLQMGKLGSNPLAGLAALGLGGLATPANTGGLNPAGERTVYNQTFCEKANINRET